MSLKFICRKCAKGRPSSACAHQMSGETAFMENIRENLKCVLGGNITPEWEVVNVINFNIPLNFPRKSETGKSEGRNARK